MQGGAGPVSPTIFHLEDGYIDPTSPDQDGWWELDINAPGVVKLSFGMDREILITSTRFH